MPILTEKQLDEMFLQALMRMKTEPTLYHEETKKILTGIIKERQCMESELNVCWNRCNKDYERMEQLYFQIAAKRYQEDVYKRQGFSYAIRHFLDCVKEDRVPLTNAVDAYKTHELLDRILRSAGLPGME